MKAEKKKLHNGKTWPTACMKKIRDDALLMGLVTKNLDEEDEAESREGSERERKIT